MTRQWTAEELIEFETSIAEAFNRGEIRAPIHLSDGSEQQLIDLFTEVGPDDWVFCSWRSHLQCLLKGVDPAEVSAEILAGRSISLCFPRHRIYSSAIVGGIVPIATGVALGIKRAAGPERVWCFVGDMTAEIGLTTSAIRYSLNHHLPLTFVVEDNGRSVLTDTKQVWGIEQSTYADQRPPNVRYYSYAPAYPHAGAGVRVEF